MKKYKIWGVFLMCTVFLLSITSCSESNYLDINHNPNYPSTATYKTLVPAAEASTVSVLGLYGTLTGNMWCQYTTQGNTTNQYNTLCAYTVLASSTTPPVTYLWQNAYSNALEDLKLALEDAENNNQWNYWLVAKVLQAYNYLLLTDTYGDIPFTEALNSEYPNPKFDNSEDVVYPGILSMLDEAIAKSNEAITAESASPMGNIDCFFGGSMSKWVSFAKSLKLKMYLKSYNKYSTQIAALLNEGGLLEEDCAWTSWEDATNKSNPLYEYNIRQLNTTENIRACHTFLEYMLSKQDPRIVYIYEPTSAAREKYPTETEWLNNLNECYEGLAYGAEKADADITPIAQTSRYRQRYDDPVYLMNASECELMIAEAYARANDKINAEDYYKKAVLNGFSRWGLDGSSFVTGVYKFDSNDMIRSIAMQYWITYAGANSYDGWMTRNRLNIPEIQADIKVRVSEKPLDRTLTEDYILGNLVDPTASVVNPGQHPLRLVYPTNTTLYNTSAQDYVDQNGNSILTPLWWE